MVRSQLAVLIFRLVVLSAIGCVVATSESTAAAADRFAKLSPFSAVRWEDAGYRVQLAGKWYELLAINDVSATRIIDFSRSAYGPDLWQKRVDEDLVEVLTVTGAKPGDSVSLKLRAVGTEEVVKLTDVRMTAANRWAVWAARNKAMVAPRTQPAPTTAPIGRIDRKVSPFTAVRWNDARYQVQVKGTWYELLAIDEQPADKMIEHARAAYGRTWQKRIDEDLPMVLSEMGHIPGDSVTLKLRSLDTQQEKTRTAVPMTVENRWAIWAARNK